MKHSLLKYTLALFVMLCSVALLIMWTFRTRYEFAIDCKTPGSNPSQYREFSLYTGQYGIDFTFDSITTPNSPAGTMYGWSWDSHVNYLSGSMLSISEELYSQHLLDFMWGNLPIRDGNGVSIFFLGDRRWIILPWWLAGVAATTSIAAVVSMFVASHIPRTRLRLGVISKVLI